MDKRAIYTKYNPSISVAASVTERRPGRYTVTLWDTDISEKIGQPFNGFFTPESAKEFAIAIAKNPYVEKV